MTKYVLFVDDLTIARPEATALLRAAGCEHQPLWGASSTTADQAPHVEVLVTASHRVDESTLLRWPNLKMLSLAFTGYDQVNLELCRERNIHVYYVPGYSTASVSELVLGLTIGVMRKIPRGDASTRSGGWDSDGIQPGIELAGKTIGIVGTGTIGLCTAKQFLGMGCDVIGWNRTERPEFEEIGAEYRSDIETIFQESDVISLHLAANDSTYHIVDKRLLNCAQKEPILVNVARGQLVDTAALVDALKDGRLSGAGIDVYEEEPPAGTGRCQDPALNELLTLDNVVMTPHLGFKTREALHRLGEETIVNIGRFLRGDSKNRVSSSRDESGRVSLRSQDRAEKHIGRTSGLDKSLDRTLRLAGVSLRDYFSTFAVYATATSILLIATGFLKPALPPAGMVLVGFLGLWLCFQWHIATFGTRLAYRYYIEMLKRLRKEAPTETPPLFGASLAKLPWSGRQHLKPWGIRGAGLPVIYGTIFFLILLNGIDPIKEDNPTWAVLALVLSIAFFVCFTLLVWRERKRKIKWPYWRDPTR